jgi:hypothetical protein
MTLVLLLLVALMCAQLPATLEQPHPCILPPWPREVGKEIGGSDGFGRVVPVELQG